jgi:hypothetical protein
MRKSSGACSRGERLDRRDMQIVFMGHQRHGRVGPAVVLCRPPSGSLYISGTTKRKTRMAGEIVDHRPGLEGGACEAALFFFTDPIPAGSSWPTVSLRRATTIAPGFRGRGAVSRGAQSRWD